MGTTRKVLVVLAALAVVALVVVGVEGFKTSPTTTSISTSSSTSTTSQVPSTWIAVWPTTTTSKFTTSAAAARSFAVHVLGMANPIMGTYRAGDARSGEQPIRATTIAPETTVLVRQLTSDNSWWVLGATTGNIEITRPAALTRVSSPMVLAGRSTAFEAVVNATLREDGRAAPLIETTVMGGANGVVAPFHATVTFPTPTSQYGTLVLYTRSAKDGAVTEASAMRVQF
ncbi:MAG TPA: Gmad2 immunoglobulin-like domain-containing protein [Acidimicrobiales bacterium]|nr:Gmad2 immunoglobulin-like domain-containing protein [Acidimicrobiales bacterium]